MTRGGARDRSRCETFLLAPAYSTFSDIHRPEDFTDLDENGICSDGEPFEDANGNGFYDADRGISGGGGARDAVLYVVHVAYRRAFNVNAFVGMSDLVETEATTVLRNQPWDNQEELGGVGSCA